MDPSYRHVLSRILLFLPFQDKMNWRLVCRMNNSITIPYLRNYVLNNQDDLIEFFRFGQRIRWNRNIESLRVKVKIWEEDISSSAFEYLDFSDDDDYVDEGDGGWAFLIAILQNTPNLQRLRIEGQIGSHLVVPFNLRSLEIAAAPRGGYSNYTLSNTIPHLLQHPNIKILRLRNITVDPQHIGLVDSPSMARALALEELELIRCGIDIQTWIQMFSASSSTLRSLHILLTHEDSNCSLNFLHLSNFLCCFQYSLTKLYMGLDHLLTHPSPVTFPTLPNLQVLHLWGVKLSSRQNHINNLLSIFPYLPSCRFLKTLFLQTIRLLYFQEIPQIQSVLRLETLELEGSPSIWQQFSNIYTCSKLFYPSRLSLKYFVVHTSYFTNSEDCINLILLLDNPNLHLKLVYEDEQVCRSVFFKIQRTRILEIVGSAEIMFQDFFSKASIQFLSINVNLRVERRARTNYESIWSHALKKGYLPNLKAVRIRPDSVNWDEVRKTCEERGIILLGFGLADDALWANLIKS